MEFKPKNEVIILSIQETEEEILTPKWAGNTYDEPMVKRTLRGLVIKTDKGDIKLLIDKHDQCCESSGAKYLETPDNVDSFIGSKLVRIKSVDIQNTKNKHDQDDGAETQLKIVTSKGVLQYAVYNYHNGYYCHAVFKQIFDKESFDFFKSIKTPLFK